MKTWLVWVLLLIPAVAHTQTICPPDCTFPVRSLPFTGTVTWDDDNPPGIIRQWQVWIDGEAASVTTEPPFSLAVIILFAGPHDIVVKSVVAETGAVLVSMPISATMSVVDAAPSPSVPTGVTLSFVSWGQAVTSGVDVTIGEQHWTFDGTHTLLNGVWVAGGQASEYLALVSGLYCLGTDNRWYRWDSSVWTLVGDKPVS